VLASTTDAAAALLVSGAIPVGSLVSQVVSMEEVPHAFEVLSDQGAMKILVDCGGA
jgi:threonine dehydrogenase-like Zn-dependent dehydrogenase